MGRGRGRGLQHCIESVAGQAAALVLFDPFEVRWRAMLLVLGDSNADGAARVPRFPREGDDLPLDDLSWSSGGAGVNVATAFARLGGLSRLISRVGDDPAAGAALASAERAGVDLSAVQRDPGRATGVCFIVVSPNAERTFLSYRGANAFLTPPPGGTWEGARRAHVCGHALLSGAQRETALQFLREAEGRGVPLSLDLCLPLAEVHGAGLAEVLPAFELVFANEAELRRLAGGDGAADLDGAAARVVALGARSLVVKRGPLGASLVCIPGLAGGARVDVPAFPVVARDTTGAGDAFVAGYLWALGHGHDHLMAARFANAAGALTAAADGAARALPGLEDVSRLAGVTGRV